MTEQQNKSKKIRSLFKDKFFLEQLEKISKQPEDQWDNWISVLRKKWHLSWEYNETILNYLESGEIDFGLGDKDIRIISLKDKRIYPSKQPRLEFEVMNAVGSLSSEKGVYIRLPKDITIGEIKQFIESNSKDIKKALDSNYTNRETHQLESPTSKTKYDVYRLHLKGKSANDIRDESIYDDVSQIRKIINEYKEKEIGL